MQALSTSPPVPRAALTPELVERLQPAMRRVARGYVRCDAVAEEVVQETWATALVRLGTFEGRSSLKTWIFGILVNKAMNAGARERRSIPFSALDPAEDEDGPTVDPERFGPRGAWATPPRSWDEPVERLITRELRARLLAAIDQLPARQRTVLVLRDVEQLSGPEVSEMLGLTLGNQRIILHRARARLRALLERALDL